MPGNADPRSTVEEEHVCPECGSPRLVRDDVRGELVCGACGLVLAESAIDQGPEWVAHSMEEAEALARTGPPRRPLSGAAGLTTVVSYPNRDIRGRQIPEPARKAFYRLRKLQLRSAQSGRGERSSVAIGRTLDRVAAQLGLPNTVREEAAFLCRKALEAGLMRGRSVMGVVAAAVYAACRIDGVPRTLNEVESVSGIRRKAIARLYRELHRRGALRAVPIPRPQDYVSRFCAELGLSSRAQATALGILDEWDRAGLTGSTSPVGTAATAIYMAAESCGEHKYQNEVARVTGVTEVTLRSRLAVAKWPLKRFAGSGGRPLDPVHL